MKGRAVSVGERYLLVDAGTLLPAPGPAGGAPAAVTPAVRDLADLADAIAARRRREAAAAADRGGLLLAAGTSPFPADARCGCHVAVAAASVEEAADAVGRLVPWLPVLVAAAANSPFWGGADTGYASYRAQLRDAPHARAGSRVPEQDRGQDHLRPRAQVRDGGMRLSHRDAVVDVRVADVALEVDDAVLVAALVRALVDTAARQWRDGVLPAPVRPELARLATWRASRSGLSGVLVDVTARRVLPARVMVGRLLRHVRDSLEEAGDLALVEELAATLLARGTGAARQREAYRRCGQLEDVVRLLADRTVPVAELAGRP